MLYLIPLEIWYHIFKNMHPINIVDIRLTCQKFNRIVISNEFRIFWSYSKYYNDLLNPNISDINYTYDEKLKRNYNYGNHYESTDIYNIRILIICTRYGDLELSKLLLNNYKSELNLHAYNWLLECSIRSSNIKIIKHIITNTHRYFCPSVWKYALVEAISTNKFDIIKYCSKLAGNMNRYLAIAYCLLHNKTKFAEYLMKEGFFINGLCSMFPELKNNKLLKQYSKDK